MNEHDPHDNERMMLGAQWTWLARTGPMIVRSRDVDYWISRAVPFLMAEVEMQHRLHAEYREAM